MGLRRDAPRARRFEHGGGLRGSEKPRLARDVVKFAEPALEDRVEHLVHLGHVSLGIETHRHDSLAQDPYELVNASVTRPAE